MRQPSTGSEQRATHARKVVVNDEDLGGVASGGWLSVVASVRCEGGGSHVWPFHEDSTRKGQSDADGAVLTASSRAVSLNGLNRQSTAPSRQNARADCW